MDVAKHQAHCCLIAQVVCTGLLTVNRHNPAEGDPAGPPVPRSVETPRSDPEEPADAFQQLVGAAISAISLAPPRTSLAANPAPLAPFNCYCHVTGRLGRVAGSTHWDPGKSLKRGLRLHSAFRLPAEDGKVFVTSTI